MHRKEFCNIAYRSLNLVRRVCKANGDAEAHKPVLMEQASLDYIILYLLGVISIPLISAITSSECVLRCPLDTPLCPQLPSHRSVPQLFN
jgi:hypothetical protein